mmetsp:Transcript_33320/g.106324  ORF Transcript_33320/g.106324 Transcript_33320/m.106324 type:complete len:264 (+) Transcript_33320:85-876(+)
MLWLRGNTLIQLRMSGNTTMSKKPTWLLVTPGFSRSMRNDTCALLPRSRSPCRKNSSSRHRTQRLCTSTRATKCPTSAILSATCRARHLSLSSGTHSSSPAALPPPSGSTQLRLLRRRMPPPPSEFFFSRKRFSRRLWNWLRIWKWFFMSVARTMSITSCRSSECCSTVRFSRKEHLGCASSRKAPLRWWFSMGERSLYRMASGSWLRMRKLLSSPLCSKSCTAAASSPAISSMSPTMLCISPPSLITMCMVCTTSAACVRLW